MCNHENCNQSHYAKGLCRLHYRRAAVLEKVARGEISHSRQMWFGADCLQDDCNEPIVARGFCKLHYSRFNKNGDPKLVKRRPKYTENCKAIYPDNTRCSIRAYCKEYCQKHYFAWRRHGNPLTVVAKTLSEKNYVKVFQPQHPNSNKAGYILEHRLIMSNHLGRALFDDENVHHKNGNRHDNRLENLELWSTVQPSGQRVEEKLEWAVMLLKRYAFDKSLQIDIAKIAAQVD